VNCTLWDECAANLFGAGVLKSFCPAQGEAMNSRFFEAMIPDVPRGQEAWRWRRNCWIERHPAVTPYDNDVKDIYDDNDDDDDDGVVEERESEGLSEFLRRSQKVPNLRSSLVDVVITPAAVQREARGAPNEYNDPFFIANIEVLNAGNSERDYATNYRIFYVRLIYTSHI
jgi:hypothetical protein